MYKAELHRLLSLFFNMSVLLLSAAQDSHLPLICINSRIRPEVSDASLYLKVYEERLGIQVHTVTDYIYYCRCNHPQMFSSFALRRRFAPMEANRRFKAGCRAPAPSSGQLYYYNKGTLMQLSTTKSLGPLALIRGITPNQPLTIAKVSFYNRNPIRRL